MSVKLEYNHFENANINGNIKYTNTKLLRNNKVQFESSSHVGYGCIVRDSQGVVIATTFGLILGRFNPTVAENAIIVESDSLLVIKASNNLETFSLSLSLIVNDCKILARDFSSCRFVFIYRSSNEAIYVLAREVVSMTGLVRRVRHQPTLISYVSRPDLF